MKKLDLEKVSILEDLINAIKDIIYIINDKGQVLYWNSALNLITGYSDKEIEEMKAEDFFAEEDKNGVIKAVSKGFKEGFVTLEASFFTKSKKRIPYSFSGYALKIEKGEILLCGVGKNIQNLKNIENQLLEKNQELEKFNRICFKREERIIELKKRVDELLKELGRPSEFGYL